MKFKSRRTPTTIKSYNQIIIPNPLTVVVFEILSPGNRAGNVGQSIIAEYDQREIERGEA